MRWVMTLLIAAYAVPAAAAAPASYDGTYSVSLSLKPGLDGPTCASYDVDSLHVDKGQIQAGTGQSLFSGTIDATGHLDGHMKRKSGGDVAFEGNLEASEYDPTRIHIAATIVDKACGWSLGLVHE
jgi:hypothetical protein